MGYFGAEVIARSDTRLPLLRHMELVGFRHAVIFDLGDGWQRLLTDGFVFADLPLAMRMISDAAQTPVLSTYVIDSDCAHTSWAIPGKPVGSVHLPGPERGECHHWTPAGFAFAREVAEVEADLAEWAEACGLKVDEGRLRRAITNTSEQGPYYHAERQFQEMLLALGLSENLRRMRPYLDPYDDPFGDLTDPGAGVAKQARDRYFGRRGESFADWVMPAIQLEQDVFWAAHDPAADHEELARRARKVVADYRAAEGDDGNLQWYADHMRHIDQA